MSKAVARYVIRRLMVAAAVLVAASAFSQGCASWFAECQGDPTKLPCTCGGQKNPGCYPPLNDDAKRPDAGQGASR